LQGEEGLSKHINKITWHSFSLPNAVLQSLLLLLLPLLLFALP
jgi:hypothetical protein